jgi:hypothetical protein
MMSVQVVINEIHAKGVEQARNKSRAVAGTPGRAARQ